MKKSNENEVAAVKDSIPLIEDNNQSSKKSSEKSQFFALEPPRHMLNFLDFIALNIVTEKSAILSESVENALKYWTPEFEGVSLLPKSTKSAKLLEINHKMLGNFMKCLKRDLKKSPEKLPEFEENASTHLGRTNFLRKNIRRMSILRSFIQNLFSQLLDAPNAFIKYCQSENLSITWWYGLFLENSHEQKDHETGNSIIQFVLQNFHNLDKKMKKKTSVLSIESKILIQEQDKFYLNPILIKKMIRGWTEGVLSTKNFNVSKLEQILSLGQPSKFNWKTQRLDFSILNFFEEILFNFSQSIKISRNCPPSGLKFEIRRIEEEGKEVKHERQGENVANLSNFVKFMKQFLKCQISFLENEKNVEKQKIYLKALFNSTVYTSFLEHGSISSIFQTQKEEFLSPLQILVKFQDIFPISLLMEIFLIGFSKACLENPENMKSELLQSTFSQISKQIMQNNEDSCQKSKSFMFQILFFAFFKLKTDFGALLSDCDFGNEEFLLSNLSIFNEISKFISTPEESTFAYSILRKTIIPLYINNKKHENLEPMLRDLSVFLQNMILNFGQHEIDVMDSLIFYLRGCVPQKTVFDLLNIEESSKIELMDHISHINLKAGVEGLQLFWKLYEIGFPLPKTEKFLGDSQKGNILTTILSYYLMNCISDGLTYKIEEITQLLEADYFKKIENCEENEEKMEIIEEKTEKETKISNGDGALFSCLNLKAFLMLIQYYILRDAPTFARKYLDICLSLHFPQNSGPIPQIFMFLDQKLKKIQQNTVPLFELSSKVSRLTKELHDLCPEVNTVDSSAAYHSAILKPVVLEQTKLSKGRELINCYLRMKDYQNARRVFVKYLPILPETISLAYSITCQETAAQIAGIAPTPGLTEMELDALEEINEENPKENEKTDELKVSLTSILHNSKQNRPWFNTEKQFLVKNPEFDPAIPQKLFFNDPVNSRGSQNSTTSSKWATTADFDTKFDVKGDLGMEWDPELEIRGRYVPWQRLGHRAMFHGSSSAFSVDREEMEAAGMQEVGLVFDAPVNTLRQRDRKFFFENQDKLRYDATTLTWKPVQLDKAEAVEEGTMEDNVKLMK